MLSARRTAATIALITLAACGKPGSPEAQVRAAIDAMEIAAEERDVGGLMEFVSDRYRDESGEGPQEAARYVRGYFIANQSIQLLSRVERLEFPADDLVRATVTVGMIGRAAGSDAGWDLAADLYEFDVEFTNEEGDWKVTHARWRRGAREAPRLPPLAPH